MVNMFEGWMRSLLVSCSNPSTLNFHWSIQSTHIHTLRCHQLKKAGKVFIWSIIPASKWLKPWLVSILSGLAHLNIGYNPMTLQALILRWSPSGPFWRQRPCSPNCVAPRHVRRHESGFESQPQPFSHFPKCPLHINMNHQPLIAISNHHFRSRQNMVTLW